MIKRMLMVLMLAVGVCNADNEIIQKAQLFYPQTTIISTDTAVPSSGYVIYTGTKVFVDNIVANSTASFMTIHISTDRTGNVAMSSMSAINWYNINGSAIDGGNPMNGWNIENYVDGSTVTMRWHQNIAPYFKFVRITVKPNITVNGGFKTGAVVQWSLYSIPIDTMTASYGSH
jgi:hypothetical protein